MAQSITPIVYIDISYCCQAFGGNGAITAKGRVPRSGSRKVVARFALLKLLTTDIGPPHAVVVERHPRGDATGRSSHARFSRSACPVRDRDNYWNSSCFRLLSRRNCCRFVFRTIGIASLLSSHNCNRLVRHTPDAHPPRTFLSSCLQCLRHAHTPWGFHLRVLPSLAPNRDYPFGWHLLRKICRHFAEYSRVHRLCQPRSFRPLASSGLPSLVGQ